MFERIFTAAIGLPYRNVRFVNFGFPGLLSIELSKRRKSIAQTITKYPSNSWKAVNWREIWKVSGALTCEAHSWKFMYAYLNQSGGRVRGGGGEEEEERFPNKILKIDKLSVVASFNDELKRPRYKQSFIIYTRQVVRIIIKVYKFIYRNICV